MWKGGVHHRDVSASNLNLMCKDEKCGVVGVLADCDSATINNSVTGGERTSTVPFMAIELFTEQGLAGEIKDIYAHDVKSFICIIVWISLRYEDGKLREQD